MKKAMIVMTTVSLAVFAGCSSTGLKKVVLDESSNKPSWVSNSHTTWEEGGKIFFKASQQVRGNERLNACYDLARLNGKEAVISGIQEDVKGALDSHEATLSENAEVLLNKSRSAELAGKISGLRFTEDYFVRYQIGDNERIDCYVVGEVTSSDYNKMKLAIVHKIEAADPRVKEQIAQKHIEFFGAKHETASQPTAGDRSPANDSPREIH
ncbi:hypothetical protein WDW86_05630 [Bdellovibrionota bacterium FG-2]